MGQLRKPAPLNQEVGVGSYEKKRDFKNIFIICFNIIQLTGGQAGVLGAPPA